MVLKRNDYVPRFSGFKRFEEKDVVFEEGKSVVYLPGKIDANQTLEKLRNNFKLMEGVDENKNPCIAVVRKVSKESPAFKSEFPVHLDESEELFKKEEKFKGEGVSEGLALVAFIYHDRVVSPNKKMALEIARMLHLKEEKEA
jgi:hypothetical protein